MKELLHERLKRSAELSKYENFIVQIDEKEYTYSELLKNLSEEIEKYYIPRPRFEDGEPVQFGEEFADALGHSHVLHEICYRDETAKGTGAGCILKATDNCGGEYDDVAYNLWDSKFVKRPTPNVLDADGMSCNKGDEVFSTIDGEKLWIVDIHEDQIEVKTPDCRTKNFIAPYLLTHKKPVFDAEGVRICKGDTVWTKNGGIGKVVSIHYKGEKTPVRGLPPANSPFIRYEDGCWNYANEVTHRKPDSLKRLRDDISNTALFNAVTLDDAIEWSERLTKLIEESNND